MVEDGSDAPSKEVGCRCPIHFFLQLLVPFSSLDQHCPPHYLAVPDNQAGDTFFGMLGGLRLALEKLNQKTIPALTPYIIS